MEDATSSDDRNEDEKSADRDAITVSTEKALELKQVATSTRQSKDSDSSFPDNSQETQHLHKNQRANLELPAKLVPVKSPQIDSTRRTREKLQKWKSQERSPKVSNPSELSSSFSSSRLQRLLESTDWTAELDAQASISPFRQSSDRKYNPANYRSSASSTDVQRSATKGNTRRSSRPPPSSTSSIELVYDPLLRCYYDPVANKYYALAE